jgi:DNA-binding NarL/FixJ family response regulator
VSKEYRAIIVEDDPFACDLMGLLLARDWRTHVVAELGLGTEAELKKILAGQAHPIDVVLIDTETPVDPRWPGRAAQIALSAQPAPAVLYTCTRPEAGMLEHLPHSDKGGFLVKNEILYALASAVCAAGKGEWVITPGVQIMGSRAGIPTTTRLMSCSTPVARFTRREKDILRLGILLNLSQRDIADELVVSQDFVSEIMGQLYEKLGLHDILSGTTPLEDYFSDESILEHCRSILNQVPHLETEKTQHKAPWMATLAFHLLTAPIID